MLSLIHLLVRQWLRGIPRRAHPLYEIAIGQWVLAERQLPKTKILQFDVLGCVCGLIDRAVEGICEHVRQAEKKREQWRNKKTP